MFFSLAVGLERGQSGGERLRVRVVGKRGKAVAGGVGGGKVYITAFVCDVLYDAPSGGPGDRVELLNTPVEKQSHQVSAGYKIT